MQELANLSTGPSFSSLDWLSLLYIASLRLALGHEGMSLAVVHGEDFLLVYQLNWLHGQGGGFPIGIPVKVALCHRLWPDQGIDRLVA